MTVNVGNRKAQTTIKQIDALGFEKIGQEYGGTFEGIKTATITDKDGTREASLIILKPDEGDKIGVWANKVLEDLISEVKVGTFVVIKYTAQTPAKGKRSGTKLFTVTPYL